MGFEEKLKKYGDEVERRLTGGKRDEEPTGKSTPNYKLPMGVCFSYLGEKLDIMFGTGEILTGVLKSYDPHLNLIIEGEDKKIYLVKSTSYLYFSLSENRGGK